VINRGVDQRAIFKEGALENIRTSLNRQVPLGKEQWQIETATKSC